VKPQEILATVRERCVADLLAHRAHHGNDIAEIGTRAILEASDG
tara:strand:+ start:1121 stop:1252 length:132 start_codon:yes stop_codon:yes gene_type:complete